MIRGAMGQAGVNRASNAASMGADRAPGCDLVRQLGEDLSQEFSAPVGIFDFDQRIWRVIVGAPQHDFPAIDSELDEVASSGGLRLGRVALWRRSDASGPLWLVLPLPTSEAAELIAFVGFRPPMTQDDANVLLARSGSASLTESSGPAWGPSCPEPALRAWGQQAVNRLQSSHETRLYPVGPLISGDAESEHVVIGRLIRRMRISESPRRFQSLATTVLRTSLGMAAVAWLPSEAHEPVVHCGEVEGLPISSYRSFVTDRAGNSAVVVNEAFQAPAGTPSPPAGRFAVVPAGGAGWLVAVNPLHDRPISTAEIERMQYVASLIAAQASNSRTYAELKELLFGIIRALTAAIDAKDPYTCGHSERVARIAVRLAEELGMPPHKRSDLYLAGLLHDIGKIGIDDQVLKKCGALTPDEYRSIQAHVQIGVTILKDLKKLHHILPGVQHHHESMDGTGYPDHLSGEEIPLEARILAVADSFDAMSSNRPYRKRLSPTQIDEVFRKGRGTQWDARAVDALFACRNDVEAIRQKGLGESLIGAVNVTLGRA
jgi:putative nucleotidyltransferase with HDIG domain